MEELSVVEMDRKLTETICGLVEVRQGLAEAVRGLFESKQLVDKLSTTVGNINTKVEGISSSNGAFAEEYFYNSLERNMNFADVHFDRISNGYRSKRKLPDNSIVEDQFDIVMFNNNSIAIIEIKYKAERGYPKKMAVQKVPNFRLLYPEYANCNIYLGLGSMSFRKDVLESARSLGIGLLKQVGETIEYQTGWVKAY